MVLLDLLRLRSGCRFGATAVVHGLFQMILLQGVAPVDAERLASVVTLGRECQLILVCLISQIL